MKKKIKFPKHWGEMTIAIKLASNGIHDYAELSITDCTKSYFSFLQEISILVDKYNKENIDKA